MTTEEASIGKLEAQLGRWGAKLDELVSKAEEKTTGAKSDYRKRIDELKAKHDAVHAKLEEYRAAGNERWSHFKDGIEGAWGELEEGFKALTL